MAALADPASTQRNGDTKAPPGGAASGTVVDGETVEENGDVLDAPSSNPAPAPTTAAAIAPAPSTSKKTVPAATTANGKAAKKPLDPSEVNNLLHQKISQLETDASLEEEEEKAISRAVRKANKELAELVSSREDHLAKVDAIQAKYSELLHDMKRLERDHAKSRKRADQLQKEKDHSRSEMQKAVSMKHKLETLCRELQKENKRIKEESKKLAQNEQQKREELSEKFESTIWEIKSRMEEEEEGGSRRSNMEIDELFKAKFKSFVDQYEVRELHFQSILRTKELEVQWNLARYEQQRKQAEAEVNRAKALHAQVSTFSQTETELRSQLNIYVEKFKQVEDTLNNSNDLFLTFRKEMEEMSRKTKRLEKENLMLSRKSDTTNRNLLEMAEERTRHQKDYDSLKQRNAKLESICRALQKERNSLENRLRAEGEEMLEDDEGDSDYEDSDELEEGSDEGSEDDEEEVDEDTEEENLAVMAELQDLGMNGVPPVKPIIQNGNSAHVAANHA